MDGKVVLITGASSGIGQKTAVALATQGATLALVARRKPLLDAVAERMKRDGAIAEVFPGDVAEPGFMDRAVEGCLNRFGRLDVLVNNAGEGFFAAIEETTADDLDRMLAVNLKGTFWGLKAALPRMRRQGYGHIINVASTAGRRGSPYVGAYCASKFAVVGMTEALRVELLGTGIRVSLVCPGATRTGFFDVAQRRTQKHSGMVGPVESPEHVAEKIVQTIQRPRAEVIAQPLRRKVFLMLNLVAPGLVDRLIARIIGAGSRKRGEE